MVRKITFLLPQDKPNGFTVQDGLLTKYEPLLISFNNSTIDETNAQWQGWSYNSNTGTVDFTEIGGLADGTLTMLCYEIN